MLTRRDVDTGDKTPVMNGVVTAVFQALEALFWVIGGAARTAACACWR